MNVSIIDAFSKAIDWTTEVLFKPFEPGKWFVLGFCAWLAYLGERGGSFNWNFPGGGGSDFRRAGGADDWVRDNLPFFITLVIVAFFVILALIVVVLWISSRGKFMFLDGVVKNQAAVVEPWRRFGDLGNSLFVFRLLVTVSAMVFMGLILITMAALLWSSFENDDFNPAEIAILVGGIGVAVVFAMAIGLLFMIVHDFVVPVMYLKRWSIGPAFREVRGLIGSYLGTFVLYVLFKIVLVILSAMITVFAVFCTCCLVIVPYIGTVILLPLYVFLRSFPLYFLGQFGPDYARFLKLGPDEDEVAEVFT